MSDVRVPIEKEYDNPKRRSGGNGFSDLLSGRGCSTGGAANPYSLMSDFIDHAFEGDCKLDQNELEGMKVLAGLTPGEPHVAPAPTSPPAAAPPMCEPQPECPPPTMSAEEFMQEVGKTVVQSKGCTGAESKVIDQAARLTDAVFEQKKAFLNKLGDMARSNCAIDDEEAAALAGFVDGLLASSAKAPAPHRPGTEQQPPPSEPRTSERAFDSTTTAAARNGAWIDELVSSGGISHDTAQRAKVRR
jgi:hypothetical protein